MPDIEEVLNWLGDREEGAGAPLVLVGQLLRVHEVAVAVRRRLTRQVTQLTHLNKDQIKTGCRPLPPPPPLSVMSKILLSSPPG
jgi:hypothetical protein